MKRPDGVSIIAIYHFIISLPLVIGACAIIGVPLSGALRNVDPGGLYWTYFGLGIGFLFVMGGALAGVLAGWGLLRLKSWARWLAVILAVLSLPLFPIFTVIGAVIIWYLLQDHVRQAFEAGGVEVSAPEVEAAPGESGEAEGLPYVIGSEIEAAEAAETMLDVEVVAAEVEEVPGEAEQTLVGMGVVEARTIVAEAVEEVDEGADEVEEAAPETIILTAEELSEAQGEPGENEEDAEDEAAV